MHFKAFNRAQNMPISTQNGTFNGRKRTLIVNEKST